VSGGTDRFINIYDQSNERYRCSTKIAKQGGNINKMCTIDTDKLIVGQSDEKIKMYQIGSNSQDPISTYSFEESGINNLCSLND
jgi:hypothetical protein